MTTTKYEFDAVRWCRTMAKAHWQRNEHDISATFRTVAEEIDRLRAENDTLRNEARVYRAQCDMRDEWRDKVEAELAALKEAVRSVADWWNELKQKPDFCPVKGANFFVLGHHGDKSRVDIKQLDALAALVGEE